MSRVLITILLAAAIRLPPADQVWAHPPWGITVDRRGQVYFSDLETIWKIDVQGRRTVFRAGVSGRHTHELTMDEGGNLFGEDLTYEPATQRYISAIWKMTPAGGFSYVLAPTRNAPKGMSICRDRNGNMYYCQDDNPNHELVLLKRSPNGTIATLIGSPDATDKERLIVRYSIGGMAFGADGALYLTDGGNIYKVTTSGVVTTLIRKIVIERTSGNVTGKNPSTRLFGLTVDNQGNVFAADFGHQCVLKITPQGSVTTLIQGEHSWCPTGIAFRNGDVYMLEFENTTHGVRVRKLAPDGRVTMVATHG